MQTPLAVQLRQSPTPIAKGNESLLSASSPMHNVVPRKRNMEGCKPFFVSPINIRHPNGGYGSRDIGSGRQCGSDNAPVNWTAASKAPNVFT